MKHKPFHSEFMRKIILKCLRTTILATIAYIVFLVIGSILIHQIVWPPSTLYFFLKQVELYLSLLIPFAWFAMVLFIIYIYFKKTVGFIEEITAASVALSQPSDEDIRLSEELREIENRMNHIKHIALKNERDAKEADRRKNDLVVNLAHDIRTPLASVIGYLSLLDEAPTMPDEQRMKYLSITLEKSFRLEHLIDEFFEITRFNLSDISLNKKKINLTLMLRQMADEFYPLLAPHQKQAVVYTPETLMLNADSDKLSRVFNNILKNALAYSDDNSLINISAFEEQGRTIIEFTNVGDPIPPEKLDTIFERFFRLDASRSSQTGGSGLGLAIAKEIVTAHGGTITAHSQNRTTTFTVNLPTDEDS